MRHFLIDNVRGISILGGHRCLRKQKKLLMVKVITINQKAKMMKKLALILTFTTALAACSSSNSENKSIDTTPVLSPTNNELRTGTDTVGFKTDSVSADSDSVSTAD